MKRPLLALATAFLLLPFAPAGETPAQTQALLALHERSPPMTPRCVRNNNPGNIDASSGIAWRGLCPREQMSDEQKAEQRFAVFTAPEWGFRAMAITLRSYQVLHGLKTVRQIITRWAPPNENNTAAYVNSVARQLGVDPDEAIDLNDRKTLFLLAKAITQHETGGWGEHWDEAQLEKGLDLARLPA